MDIYIGLDIGGSKIMAAAAPKNGDVLQRFRNDTPLDLNEGLNLLTTLVKRLAAGHRIAAIGAAIGGPLDWQSGVVSPLHQPQWRAVPLKALMEKTFACPFFVDVDTNVAALGEWHYGGNSAAHLLYLTLSTGMGGGFLVNGRIYRGVDGAHPEVGHQAVPFRSAFPERVRCECGARDCLEALVSGNGIRRIYQKPAEALEAREWEEVAYNLGQGLRNLAAIYAPEIIVLGGGVAIGGGKKLLNPARAVLKEHLKIVPQPEIRLSKLGHDTALYGALALAMSGNNRASLLKP